MKKLLTILIVGLSLNLAHAQGNLNLSGDAQGLLKYLNDPQNKNDKLNNSQAQNDTELVMFIMKSIEDKHITETNKKIEFINSFNVSKDIKEQAINYINQNTAYSDFEKAAYGVYMLKLCNDSSRVNACYIDVKPYQGRCVAERSNICCN